MTPAKSIDDTRPRRHLRGRCYTIALQSLPLESPSPPSISCADSSPGRGAMLVQVSPVCFPQRGKWRAARADRGSLPLEGKGDRLRWMRWTYLPLISRLSATASPEGEAFFTLYASPQGKGLLLPHASPIGGSAEHSEAIGGHKLPARKNSPGVTPRPCRHALYLLKTTSRDVRGRPARFCLCMLYICEITPRRAARAFCGRA